MTFVGITFQEQKVSPSADATLMKAVISDGILYGCGLNYAGFSLTVAPGHLLLSGRNIQHPISETLSIAGATSGFARVVISIDMSKTSTVDVFEQVEAYIEYASTANGFSVLEQSEINVSGTKYQAELCVVSLSSGGITGIVRQLPAAKAEPARHTHAPSDLTEPVPMHRGGHGCNTGQAGLKNLLAAGYMVLSNYQIVNNLPNPAELPEGTFMGLLIQEV